MKQTQALFFLVALFLATSCIAATPKRLKPNPSLDRYNKAVNDFNKATQDFNKAKNANDTALLTTANGEIGTNIQELQALALTPEYKNDPTVYNLIGYLYLTQNNPAAAIPELQTTIRLNPNNLDARNNLGNAYRQTQRYDDAAAQYQYIVDHSPVSATGPSPARVKFNLATSLGQAGRTDEALALFSQLVAASPDAAIYKNYAFFLQKAGHKAEAADAMHQAAVLNPKDATAWLAAGELYASNQRYDEAIANLTKAVGSDVSPALSENGQYDAQFALGESFAAKSDFNQAIADFGKAAALQPANAVPLYNKGVVQEQAGLRADAEASYRAALQKDPENTQIQIALGLLLANEGNSSESATYLSGAVSRLPQNAQAAPIYARLGDQYAKQGDYTRAEQSRRQALTLNPADADTRLAIAADDMDRRQYVSALVQYDAAARLRPTDPAIQNGRGAAYKNLKQYAKALAAFKQAQALDPSSAQVQNNIGVLYELLGKKASAIIAYKKALALNPGLTVARQNLSRFVRK